MLILPESLPIVRYRLTFDVQAALRLPPYAGSLLRGVFGHALRECVCVCGQNLHHDADCPYSQIFTAPPSALVHHSQQNTPPQPYVFEARFDDKTHYARGEQYTFCLVLLGQTRHLLSLIVSSLQYAFARGVGEDNRGKAQLCDVSVQQGGNWQSIWEHGVLLPHDNDLILPKNYASNVRMVLDTPIRIQQKGKIIGAMEMSPDMMLRQMMRRVSSVAQLYFATPLQADYAQLGQLAGQVQNEPNFYWRDWQRYSNRQKQSMKLGGVMGQCIWRDLPLPFAQLLYLGQWLHMGKETVFGLGAYHLQAIE